MDFCGVVFVEVAADVFVFVADFFEVPGDDVPEVAFVSDKVFVEDAFAEVRELVL